MEWPTRDLAMDVCHENSDVPGIVLIKPPVGELRLLVFPSGSDALYKFVHATGHRLFYCPSFSTS